MSSFWKQLLDQMRSVASNQRWPLPATYLAVASDDGPAKDCHRVFDPALRHLTRAYRPGDPALADPVVAARWHAARRHALDHVLRLVAGSRWGQHLVLRGSLLLKAWLGDAAREPGDMDFVVTPHTLRIADDWADELFVGLAALVRASPCAANQVVFDGECIAVDDIWTYERAPGRRIVFPWNAEGLPAGAVQLDAVFGEQLAQPPARTAIPLSGGSAVTVLAATKHLSLVWKLYWLQTDACPQGKDLYDATLLAERLAADGDPLPLDLLERTIGEGQRAEALHADFPTLWDVDWENFCLECPWVPGKAADWQRRLTEALAPTFNDTGLPGQHP